MIRNSEKPHCHYPGKNVAVFWFGEQMVAVTGWCYRELPIAQEKY
jgi:hypothetical protein